MKNLWFLIVMLFALSGCKKSSTNSERDIEESNLEERFAMTMNSLSASDLRELKALANGGNVKVQYNLGYMYDHGEGSVTEDKNEAAKWYRMAADQDVAFAQYALAVLYDKGEGVPENKKEAMKWFLLAAEQGVAEAQYHYGFNCMLGLGVNIRGKDAELEGAKWLRRASNQGHKEAQRTIDAFEL